MFSHGKSNYARPWTWIGILPVMNLEEILVRNLVTKSGRASLPAKPEIPISVQKFRFRTEIGNYGFAGRDARPLVVPKFRTKISSRFIIGSMPIQVHGRAYLDFPCENIQTHFSVRPFCFCNGFFWTESRKLDQYSSENLRSSSFEWSNCELRPISPPALAVASSWPIDIINKKMTFLSWHP